jgi:hypothetical protein
LLTSRGVKVQRDTINASDFALEHLQALGSWKPHLGFDHVHSTLRSKFTSMQDLWGLDSSRHGEDFKSVVDQAVATCVAEHTQYSPEVLLSAVVSAVATALSVSTQGMLQAMHSHQASPIRTEDEFHLIAEAPAPEAGGAPAEDQTRQAFAAYRHGARPLRNISRSPGSSRRRITSLFIGEESWSLSSGSGTKRRLAER